MYTANIVSGRFYWKCVNHNIVNDFMDIKLREVLL